MVQAIDSFLNDGRFSGLDAELLLLTSTLITTLPPKGNELNMHIGLQPWTYTQTDIYLYTYGREEESRRIINLTGTHLEVLYLTTVD